MQNYGMGLSPYILIIKFIFEENTLILHSAFSILYFGRQLDKLQLIFLLACVKTSITHFAGFTIFIPKIAI